MSNRNMDPDFWRVEAQTAIELSETTTSPEQRRQEFRRALETTLVANSLDGTDEARLTAIAALERLRGLGLLSTSEADPK